MLRVVISHSPFLFFGERYSLQRCNERNHKCSNVKAIHNRSCRLPAQFDCRQTLKFARVSLSSKTSSKQGSCSPAKSRAYSFSPNKGSPMFRSTQLAGKSGNMLKERFTFFAYVSGRRFANQLCGFAKCTFIPQPTFNQKDIAVYWMHVLKLFYT